MYKFLPLLFLLAASSGFGAASLDVGLGITRGGASLGGMYMPSAAEGQYGIYLRMVPKNENVSSSQTGVTSIGGCYKALITSGSTDFYGIGGGGLVMISPVTGSSQTSIGPTIGFGVMHHLKKGITVGLDHVQNIVWSGDFTGTNYTSNLLLFSIEM